MLIKVSDLIRESWTLYKQNFVTLAKIVVWLLIPAVILSILPALNLSPALFLPLNFFFSVVSIVFELFIFLALILTISALLRGEKINLKNIYSSSYPKFISYLWVSILASLVILAGTLLLIIPGIIFAVWFSFSVFIVVLENIKGIKALSASKALVENRFWAVLWRWVAPYFVYGVALFVIIFILIYLLGLALGDPRAGFAPVTPWWSAIISNIIYFLAIPIFTTIGVLLYQSLKKEKETSVPPVK